MRAAPVPHHHIQRCIVEVQSLRRDVQPLH